MHVDIVPNRSSKPAVLLRETWREGGRVRKRTLANLSDLSMEQAMLLRRVLKGEKLVAPSDAFRVTRSRAEGHVRAVLIAMRRLRIEQLLGSRPSTERSLLMALIAYRVLNPRSKLATTRAWSATTLPEELGVLDADENDVYRAMDWLIGRKDRIEGKLAARHLEKGSRVRFDLSSSYLEGEHCSIAEFGYNRDQKRGKKQINWGLVTDDVGRPIALSVFPGSTSDSRTLMPQVDLLRDRFGLREFVLIGDRGMITKGHIERFRQHHPGIDWITALKSASLRKLVHDGTIQPSLFDETNLLEVQHDDFPGERLIACRNPMLERKRAHKRKELLTATAAALQKIQQRIRNGRLSGRDKIGLKVGEGLARYKMNKHFKVTITDDDLAFEIDDENVRQEALMDGIYVIRTSVTATTLSAANTVRAYKELADVERAFRTLKSVDLQVRPIHHRLADRVTAHLFICMLAYYVRWHLERAWASLTFKDDDIIHHHDRDPVAPAARSDAATTKAQSRTLPDGNPTRNFKTVLDDLASITRNTCTHTSSGATFPMTTSPTPQQQQALDLLESINV